MLCLSLYSISKNLFYICVCEQYRWNHKVKETYHIHEMFSFQEKMVSITTFPHPLPFRNALLSSEDSPSTLLGQIVWCMTAYDTPFLQVMFKGIASLVFKSLIRLGCDYSLPVEQQGMGAWQCM